MVSELTIEQTKSILGDAVLPTLVCGKSGTPRSSWKSFFGSFFVVVISLGFGVLAGYLLSYHTFPGVSGQATPITVPTSLKTPHVKDVSGKYYILSAREKRFAHCLRRRSGGSAGVPANPVTHWPKQSLSLSGLTIVAQPSQGDDQQDFSRFPS